jgi:uncharacterized protein (DUF2062 family)
MNEFLFWFMEPFAKIAAICAIVITLYAAFMLWLFVMTAIEKFKEKK